MDPWIVRKAIWGQVWWYTLLISALRRQRQVYLWVQGHPDLQSESRTARALLHRKTLSGKTEPNQTEPNQTKLNQTKPKSEGWRDVWTIQSSGHSFRGPRLGLQHLHGGSHPSVTIHPGNLMSFSGFYVHHKWMWYTDIHADKTLKYT